MWGLGTSQGQQPCRKQHWFNWELGCVSEAGRSHGQGAYLSFVGYRGESCSHPDEFGMQSLQGVSVVPR